MLSGKSAGLLTGNQFVQRRPVATANWQSKLLNLNLLGFDSVDKVSLNSVTTVNTEKRSK